MTRPAPPAEAPATPAPEISRLAALGRRLLRYDLVGKVDLSGVVQQTLLDAHAAGPTVPAHDPRQRAAWLTKVFRRNLTDSVRMATAARRDATREVPLDAPAASPERWLRSDASTPSGKAVRAEDEVRLAEALTRLPPDQARAVELRHLHGRAVGEIAEAMGRTPGAVAGLLKRGLRALRGLLTETAD